MQLPIDERVLEVLSSDLTLSPTIIAENIEKSREEVNRRLTTLTNRGFVNRVDRGRYRIAEDGRSYLAGELDASNLEERSGE
jgi:DNA-binding IclR family transcriptional regulator